MDDVFERFKDANQDPTATRAHADIYNEVLHTGVFFRPDRSRGLTHLAPHAIRDPKCRAVNNHGFEEWGSPDSRGRMRDDNSLVGGALKYLNILEYDTGNVLSPIKKGYTASHIWRTEKNGQSLNLLEPLFYSATANVCLLPYRVSLLSDVRGSYTQSLIAACAMELFSARRPDSSPLLQRFFGLVDLEETEANIARFGIDLAGLRLEKRRYFMISPAKIGRFGRKLQGICAVLRGQDAAVRPKRYKDGLRSLAKEHRDRMLEHLAQFQVAP